MLIWYEYGSRALRTGAFPSLPRTRRRRSGRRPPRPATDLGRASRRKEANGSVGGSGRKASVAEVGRGLVLGFIEADSRKHSVCSMFEICKTYAILHRSKIFFFAKCDILSTLFEPNKRGIYLTLSQLMKVLNLINCWLTVG